jgi:hypothetical protein
MISSLEQLSALAVVKLSELPSQMGSEDKSVISESQDGTSCKGQTLECSGFDNKISSESSSNKINISGGICRQPAVSVAQPRSNPVDWARQITADERRYIRDKIKAAYMKKMANSFEDLLETCAAIEEELVFSSAPSRLDYFKSGVQFEKRVAEKRCEMKNALMAVQSTSVESSISDSDQPKPIKRAKTNH